RFRYGSGCYPLSLATNSNSPAHSTKGTPSACATPRRVSHLGLLQFVGPRFQVSISLPAWGAFHLSLTVLFTIGHQEYLALHSGLCGFPQDSACPGVLGCRSGDRSAFAYRAVTFCGAGFHQLRLTAGFVTPLELGRAR